MKTTAILITIWLLNLCCFGQESVRPCVAVEFGKPILVTCKFVAKPNTYYDQNWVSEPYTLKVISVNGQALKEAVLIEYKLVGDRKTIKGVEKAGTVREFEAYETLYQPHSSTPWLAEGEQGMSFYLNHLLHIRLVNGKSK